MLLLLSSSVREKEPQKGVAGQLIGWERLHKERGEILEVTSVAVAHNYIHSIENFKKSCIDMFKMGILRNAKRRKKWTPHIGPLMKWLFISFRSSEEMEFWVSSSAKLNARINIVESGACHESIFLEFSKVRETACCSRRIRIFELRLNYTATHHIHTHTHFSRVAVCWGGRLVGQMGDQHFHFIFFTVFFFYCEIYCVCTYWIFTISNERYAYARNVADSSRLCLYGVCASVMAERMRSMYVSAKRFVNRFVEVFYASSTKTKTHTVLWKCYF